MKVYISGISGTGMGPLALMARDAGFEVCGSDLSEGAVYPELQEVNIEVAIGKQDGKFLQKKIEEGVDWFIYTSALPNDHPELKIAREAGIRCTKRDEFTEFLVESLGLKMIAVAGTHGKTTTAAMIVWVATHLGLPVAHVVGTTLGFSSSGAYNWKDEYFVYEADEYDRNFLRFHPWLTIVTCVTYDHPDTYKKPRDYRAAFLQLKAQSDIVLEVDEDSEGATRELYLAGEARRQNARRAIGAIAMIYKDRVMRGYPFDMGDLEACPALLSDFPGVGRRFEWLADGVYTDYAHHPEEIAATMDAVRDEMRFEGKKGAVVIYQPHQNVRQHKVKADYKDVFRGADKIYWLPTYLTREDPKLPVITPEEFISGLSNSEVAEPAELDDKLEKAIRDYLAKGYLVILMSAGPADAWLRERFMYEEDEDEDEDEDW